MKEKLTLGASVASAITASLCCICPLVVVLLGFGTFGATAMFEALRPYFLGLSFLFLVSAFYLTYRSQQESQCANGVCNLRGIQRLNKPLLWIATGAVILFAAFPYYSGAVSGSLSPETTQAVTEFPIRKEPRTPQVQRIDVEGMTCGGCAVSVHQALVKLPGVVSAEVSFENKQAVVRYDSIRITPQQLVDAISQTGFKASLR